jgi:hypothetical protein
MTLFTVLGLLDSGSLTKPQRTSLLNQALPIEQIPLPAGETVVLIEALLAWIETFLALLSRRVCIILIRALGITAIFQDVKAIDTTGTCCF